MFSPIKYEKVQRINVIKKDKIVYGSRKIKKYDTNSGTYRD